MDTTAEQPDATATAGVEEDDFSVRVTLSRTNKRAWLRLRGPTLTVEGRLTEAFSSSTGFLPFDLAFSVAAELTSDESLTVDAEEVIVLPPRRRFTGGQIMALIPAVLFAVVALVVTIVALADPRQSDLGLAAGCWILSAVSLAPALPFVLKGRSTARIKLGREGHVIEFWYRPGSRKHKALDVFFVRLFQLQGVLDEKGLAPLALLWNGTPWESLEAPEEGSPRTSRFVLGGILGVILLGAFWVALELSGLLFLALVGLLVVLVIVGAVVRRLRSREMRKAERLWDRGRYDAAAKWLHKLLAKRPQHQPAWRMYIEYYVQRGDFGAAFACCDTMEGQGLVVSASIRERIARFRELNDRDPDADPAEVTLED